ncbi:MAG: hypothetical protein HY756_11500 [Nitrospirae bacterium]|nr:hypothetical protein [Nitrospirota bacterium]
MKTRNSNKKVLSQTEWVKSRSLEGRGSNYPLEMRKNHEKGSNEGQVTSNELKEKDLSLVTRYLSLINTEVIS